MTVFRKIALIGIAVAVVPVLQGCNSVYRGAFSYDVPESAEPLPEGYPNVYTSISRDDVLRSPASKDAEIKRLERDRASHVARTRAQIRD